MPTRFIIPPPMRLRARWLALALLFAAGWPRAAAEQPFTLKLELQHRQLEGAPLAWSETEVHLLARDGAVWSFAPREASNVQRGAARFASYSPAELRGRLQLEFGKAYQVSPSAHYLVVHPRGQRAVWPARFEQLYRCFTRYFAARGWQPETPRFPLIALVFPSRSEFLRYAAAEGAALAADTTGYYSPKTNRVALFELDPAAQRGRADTHQETVFHEAAHQLAFNTGVHNRLAAPPRWVAEGLSTMFESRGWDARSAAQGNESLNRGRLAVFRKLAATQPLTGRLADFVAADEPFDSSAPEAYATAWALSYFLAETAPRDYVRYLRLTAARPPFSPYSAAERQRDFRSVFGANLALLEARFARFMLRLADG